MYESQDEPCQYCVLRNLSCEKVRGPKTSGVVVSASLKSPIWNPGPAPADETLTDRERFYLHALYWQCMGLNGIYSITMQHLWMTYGYSLPHGAIRCAALAITAMRGNSKIEACEFISRFHSSLDSAICNGTVGENELFALLIVCLSGGLYDNDVNTRYMYLVGILEIGSYLSNKSDRSPDPPLRCLWKTAIQWARNYESMLGIPDKSLSLALKFHFLAENIPDHVTTSDRRLTALTDWHKGLLREPPWVQLYQLFESQIHSLRAIFEFHLQSPNVPQNSRANWLRHSLNSMEMRYLNPFGVLHTVFFEPQSVTSLYRSLLNSQTPSPASFKSYDVEAKKWYCRTAFYTLLILHHLLRNLILEGGYSDQRFQTHNPIISLCCFVEVQNGFRRPGRVLGLVCLGLLLGCRLNAVAGTIHSLATPD